MVVVILTIVVVVLVVVEVEEEEVVVVVDVGVVARDSVGMSGSILVAIFGRLLLQS